MTRHSKRSLGLALFLALAVVVSWFGEIIALHDHDVAHPDPCCMVCRGAGSPGQVADAGAIPTGVPILDVAGLPAPSPAALHIVTPVSAKVSRAPPTD